MKVKLVTEPRKSLLQCLFTQIHKCLFNDDSSNSECVASVLVEWLLRSKFEKVAESGPWPDLSYCLSIWWNCGPRNWEPKNGRSFASLWICDYGTSWAANVFKLYLKAKNIFTFLWLHSSPYIKVPYLLNYLITQWSRVNFEKLTGSLLVKKFPTLYGTRRFITTFTRVRHLSLSWARSIQSMPPHFTSWRSMLTLSSHQRLGLPSGIFSSGFPTKTLYALSSFPYLLHAAPIPFFWIWSPE